MENGYLTDDDGSSACKVGRIPCQYDISIGVTYKGGTLRRVLTIRLEVEVDD